LAFAAVVVAAVVDQTGCSRRTRSVASQDGSNCGKRFRRVYLSVSNDTSRDALNYEGFRCFRKCPTRLLVLARGDLPAERAVRRPSLALGTAWLFVAVVSAEAWAMVASEE
jgi:hypothetical protein